MEFENSLISDDFESLPSVEEHLNEWSLFCSSTKDSFTTTDILNSERLMEPDDEKFYEYIYRNAFLFLKTGKRINNKTLIKLRSLEVELPIKIKSSSSHYTDNLVVNFANSPMGYGDYLQRMERIYNLLSNITNSKFNQSPYTNPHVSDLDFSQYISIDFDFFSEMKFDENYILEFEEFFYLLGSGLLLTEPSICYSVYLHKAYKSLDDIFEGISSNSFFNKVRFSENVNLSEKQSDCFNLVFHLRRHDTALALLEGKLPLELEKKMGVSRPLLTSALCERIADTYLRLNNLDPAKINIFVISDGFLGLIERYEKVCFFNKITVDPDFIQYLTKLEYDLINTKPSIRNSTLNTICVGRDKVDTLKSLDIIANADLVITSSGFAIVLSKIANSVFINGFPAIKAESSEALFDDACKGSRVEK